MKFTCLQENLSKALSIVGKAVSAKSTLPVLSNVLLATDKGRLKLSATNLEVAISVWIGCEVEEEGSVTVPARLFSEFVSNLPPSNVVGESDGLILKLQCNKTTSRFNGLSASEFPTLPDAVEDVYIKVDPKVFSEAVLETSFASATDESRPVLTGVLVKVHKNKLHFVGVDGFRLAERVIELGDKKASKELSIVIPAKIIAEVARLVSGAKEPVEISLSSESNLVVFKADDILVSSRTLDGEFPDYEKLIPEEGSAALTVSFLSKDMANALKLANVFAKDSVSVVKLRVSSEDGVVYVTSSNSELGENSNSVEAEIDGSDLEVAFNSRYILDVLGNVKADKFVFESSEKIGPGVPGVLKPAGRDDYIYLAMPIQM